jgi:PAS domain S-box-containing protein
MQEKRQTLHLSPRESQLVKFASEGLTDTAIALRLGISEATVGTYWGRVRIKMGPYNRTELVSIFLKTQQEEALDALRQENAQLLRHMQEIAASNKFTGDLYRHLMDHAPDAIVLVAERGTILHANHSAHDLFGYDPGVMNGLHISALIPERLRTVHQEHRAAYISSPQKRTMGEHLETPARRADGSELRVRAALSALSGPDGLLITCVLRLAGSD